MMIRSMQDFEFDKLKAVLTECLNGATAYEIGKKTFIDYSNVKDILMFCARKRLVKNSFKIVRTQRITSYVTNERGRELLDLLDRLFGIVSF